MSKANVKSKDQVAQKEDKVFLIDLMNYLLFELPGPKIIKFNWSINL